MARQRKKAAQGGFSAGMLCAVSALLLGVPSAGLALGAIGTDAVTSSLGTFTPASVNPALAKFMGGSLDDKMMRFTPAGADNRSGRSVTVAVRVDEKSARSISVRQAMASAGEPTVASMPIRLTPTRYSLGLMRGYQSFARTPEVTSSLTSKLSDAAIPDLASFQPSAGAKDKPSRFNARIALDEAEPAGRAPRTRDSLGDQTLDVGGSYSVTRNIDVTAGVRLSQDRDRLVPVNGNGQQDGQAVYVGTQFRF